VCLKRTHSIDNTFYRKHILSAAVGDIADQNHERSVRARASEKKRKGVEKKSARVPVKKKRKGVEKKSARVPVPEAVGNSQDQRRSEKPHYMTLNNIPLATL
jgi:hypothetical protein